MWSDFAAFILTHGRPENVVTYNTLKRGNYTGKIYILVDNEDETVEEYKKKFENVIVFDKEAVFKKTEMGDNFEEPRGVIIGARNAAFNIAKSLGLKYFLALDDDYTSFNFKFEADGKFKGTFCYHLDDLFGAMLKFLKKSNAKTVALAQGGDFIGGVESGNYKKGIMRKAMNSFFVKTDNDFRYFGRINEDVNTYVVLGMRGELFLTVTRASLNQINTQKNKGGMTGAYIDAGTYVKSFYTVIYAPSCTRLFAMGSSHRRIHHKIKWNNAVPKILNEKYKR